MDQIKIIAQVAIQWTLIESIITKIRNSALVKMGQSIKEILYAKFNATLLG